MPGCAGCLPSPAACWWSSWSAPGSPARSRCSPTPATWPPTPVRSSSRSGRRTSPACGAAPARRSATTASRSSPRWSTRSCCSGSAATWRTPASPGWPTRPTWTRGSWSASRRRPGRQRGVAGSCSARDTGSLNLRGAVNEVFADLLGSVLAIAAGLVILVCDWQHADPIASLVIAVMILPRALLLMRDAAVVLLEIAPAGLDLDDVEHHLCGVPGVVDVHDLHAWTITSGMPSLSAHVTVTDEMLAERGVGRDPRRPRRVRRGPLRRPPHDVPGRAGVARGARGPRGDALSALDPDIGRPC